MGTGETYYLFYVYQLFTRDGHGGTAASQARGYGLLVRFKRRKTFSHRRNNFPRTALTFGIVIQQRVGES